MVWGANFAVRRSAVDRIGEFDESFDRGHGDEEDWLHAAARRGRADRLPRRRGTRPPPRGGRFRPRLARARRVPPRPRARGRATGVTARRPAWRASCATLAGAGWHTVRRACPQGVIMGAHAAGRLVEALQPAVTRPDPDSFLSGDGGDVTDPWRRAKRTAGELAYGAIDAVTGTRLRAGRLARKHPRAARRARDRRVPGRRALGRRVARTSLESPQRAHRARRDGRGGSSGCASRRWPRSSTGGKFENLNRVLEAAARAAPDWTIVVDDDVRLPHAFLDRFLAVCEAFELDLAQPAQTLRSHSAWKVTRRRPASLVRVTRFVEIGPVTAFGAARRRRAAAVPRAPVRLGARPPLGRARRPERLAARRGRRAARAPRVRARGRRPTRATTPSRRPRAS